MTTELTNRLAAETSPYLQQHADNPVDWYPWCDEALDRARREDKPILLSIGYSACHWCHVMAHESFEDPATARVMNEHFINIKVDREERPDIDRVYQTAHQILAQRGGGWPLTLFLEPESQRPFFGGTYFPKEPRHGMPAFTDLLERAAGYFREQRDAVRSQAAQIAAVFDDLDPTALQADAELSDGPIRNVRERLGRSADREYGGIGSAPKFPQAAQFERLLRHWRASANDEEPDVEALFLVTLTASRMAEGGLFDQLGGGFCRYSVDRYWQIPHFEKMLYDNGQLLALYAWLHVATGEPMFARVARETAEYLLTDLQAEDGGFFSSRDADSGGGEGRYYLWTPDEVKQHLDADDYDLFASHFGLDQPANFEGQWHLTIRRSLRELADELGESADELQAVIDRCRETLLEVRTQREAPGRDDKRLTAWNALAIRGLAVAGRCLQDESLIDAAVRAVDFIARRMIRDGHLHATYKDGKARFPAYLDDHAFLLDALLELLQSRWRRTDLDLATDLAEQLLTRFYDAEDGGFFFTANDAERLMARPKPLADEAMPSGNGVAAFALQRLGFLLGESRYLHAAERTLRFGWQAMEEFPHGHPSLVTALEELRSPPEIVVLRGAAAEIARWRDAAARLYAPRRLVFAIPAAAENLPGSLAERRPVAGGSVAYRCVGHQCSLPITSFEALAAEISERSNPPD